MVFIYWYNTGWARSKIRLSLLWINKNQTTNVLKRVHQRKLLIFTTSLEGVTRPAENRTVFRFVFLSDSDGRREVTQSVVRSVKHGKRTRRPNGNPSDDLSRRRRPTARRRTAPSQLLVLPVRISSGAPPPKILARHRAPRPFRARPRDEIRGGHATTICCCYRRRRYRIANISPPPDLVRSALTLCVGPAPEPGNDMFLARCRRRVRPWRAV